jgi:tRNA nucleotidyltransferase (CCA-adding enzyme)
MKKLIEILKVINPNSNYYYVGGYVRDLIMGISNSDIDICVTGYDSFESLTKALEACQSRGMIKSFKPVDNSFPIHIVNLEDVSFELAMARTENKIGEKRQDFSCNVKNITIEQDLKRRDFTINSIAIDFLKGETIDPFGGVRDVGNRVLRPTSEAFKEDPLRIYRGARFAATLPGSFSFSPEFYEYANEMIDMKISRERIGTELKKVFKKAIKPSVFFDSLKRVDYLSKFFPDLYKCIGVKQDPGYHPEGDVYNHTMLCIDAATDELTRAVMLCHDLGKHKTTTIDDKGRIRSIGHEIESAEIARKLYTAIAYDNHGRIKQISLLCALHMRKLDLSKKAIHSILRQLSKEGLNYSALVRVFKCDAEGAMNVKMLDYYEDYAKFVIHEGLLTPIVTSDMLKSIGIQEGPFMGQVLKQCIKLQDRGTLNKDNWTKLVKQIKPLENGKNKLHSRAQSSS